jgi:hypothetical protein
MTLFFVPAESTNGKRYATEGILPGTSRTKANQFRTFEALVQSYEGDVFSREDTFVFLGQNIGVNPATGADNFQAVRMVARIFQGEDQGLGGDEDRAEALRQFDAYSPAMDTNNIDFDSPIDTNQYGLNVFKAPQDLTLPSDKQAPLSTDFRPETLREFFRELVEVQRVAQYVYLLRRTGVVEWGACEEVEVVRLVGIINPDQDRHDPSVYDDPDAAMANFQFA